MRQKGRTRFACFYGMVLCGTFFTAVVAGAITVVAANVLDSDVSYLRVVSYLAPVSYVCWFVIGLWLWARIESEYQDQMRRDAATTNT